MVRCRRVRFHELPTAAHGAADVGPTEPVRLVLRPMRAGRGSAFHCAFDRFPAHVIPKVGVVSLKPLAAQSGSRPLRYLAVKLNAAVAASPSCTVTDAVVVP